jgi:sulfatase modifying factor 1
MRPLLTCILALLLLSSFNDRMKKKLKIPDEFVLIPGGTTYLGNPDDSHFFDSSKRITIMKFYMSKYEVTNSQYRTFFKESSTGMTSEEKEKIACDTTGWDQALTYCEPMKQYYYSHPAYNDYPVVNVSYYGASKYCEWLQKKLQSNNPEFEIEVNLPSKSQWIWAAMGGRSQAMYPWGNFYLRNKKGEFLCNFKRLGDQAIYRNKKTGKPEVAEPSSDLSDRAFYTSTVKSFYPNDFGLYNMCGNAAEMIEEKGTGMGGSWNDYGGDVHIRSESMYDKSSPTIGFRPIVIYKEKDKD